MGTQAGELSVALMLTASLLVLHGTDVDVLACTVPRGLLPLAEVYDCPPEVEGRL